MYNGHKSYNAWNVSLWINNDEGLYRLAKSCIRCADNRDSAADAFISEVGTETTPDGVKWTKTNVKLAMVGI